MLNNIKEYEKTINECNEILKENVISSGGEFLEKFAKIVPLLLQNKISKQLVKIYLQNISKKYSNSFTDIRFSNLNEIYEAYFINYNVTQIISSTAFKYFYNIPMIYNLKDGSYKETTESEILQLLRINNPSLSSKGLKEIYESLKIEGYLDISHLNNHKNLNLIHCQNGMLDISNETFNLIPLDHKYYSTSCLNVEFISSSTCPEWIKFLDKTFELYYDEKDIAINLLKEFIGYSLVHGNSLQKMLTIIGKPRTGKSVIADIIHEILGHKNTSSIPFDELNDPTKISSLIGKLANISGELSKGKKIDSSRIKSLIGEDYLSCKKLYQDPIHFQNEAKLISIGNYPPSFKETSNAMLERILILNLDNVVPENERDPFLKDKLKAEKNGIFLWCVEGLINLKKRGNFLEPSKSIKSKEKINKSSNSIAEWLEDEEENISWDSKHIITLKALYDCYKNFCFTSGISDIESKNSFKEFIEQSSKMTVFKDPQKRQFIVKLTYIETENNI